MKLRFVGDVSATLRGGENVEPGREYDLADIVAESLLAMEPGRWEKVEKQKSRQAGKERNDG